MRGPLLPFPDCSVALAVTHTIREIDQESLVVSEAMDWLMAQKSGGTTQQKYHGIVGVAVDDIAGGTSNLQVEATFHFRTLGCGKWKILQS